MPTQVVLPFAKVPGREVTEAYQPWVLPSFTIMGAWSNGMTPDAKRLLAVRTVCIVYDGFLDSMIGPGKPERPGFNPRCP